jgi:hydrogenase-4 membrane subunit HyfE
MNHTNVSMIIIMFVSGLLSSMYIWSDKISNMRVSINDIYMSSLMTAWMFLLMGIYHKIYNYILPSLIVILVTLYMIRNQSFVTPSQYIKGMIPHHSMAITMSKRLIDNYSSNLENKKYIELKKLLLNIISTQEREIDTLKKLEML